MAILEQPILSTYSFNNMQNKNIITFIKKIGVFLLPVFALIIWYLNSDPFKVIHTYRTYSNQPIDLNQGYISWQSYLNHKDSLKYDSFIFGNSCTMAYPTTLWKNYLQGASAIRLNGNSESLYAIHKKIKRLDELGVPIKNILLLLDHNTLRKLAKTNSHSRILHPDVSHIKQIEFQKEFMAAFFNPEFLIPYVDYMVFGKFRNYMKGIIITKDYYRNNQTNDIINPRELEIEQLGQSYWDNHKKEFPLRSNKPKEYAQVIFNKQNKILNEINEIFKKHHTNYQIIINPEWSQRKLNNLDLKQLKSLFDPGRIHNFSGKNQYTQNKTYFYEKNHYRPLLGKIILQEIYKQ